MKNKMIFSFTMAVMVLFAACKSDDGGGVTKLTLDKETATVEVGKTLTLTATVEPAGSTVKWESSNTTCATVSDGVVTGVAKGTAMIVASAGEKTASCMVTVGEIGGKPEPPSKYPSLQGSEYFIIQIDGISVESIKSKIKADFRPDDVTKHLYIWTEGDNLTYDSNDPSGLCFYEEPGEGWVSLTVRDQGWSGFGYSIGDLNALNALSAIMASPDDYYFHIAMKSTDQASHLFGIDGSAGTGKVCIGGSPFVDKGVPIQPYKNITRDGEWNEIEIPMSYFLNQGVVFSNNNTEAKNIFWGLSGAEPGVTLQYDACFIYKK